MANRYFLNEVAEAKLALVIVIDKLCLARDRLNMQKTGDGKIRALDMHNLISQLEDVQEQL